MQGSQSLDREKYKKNELIKKGWDLLCFCKPPLYLLSPARETLEMLERGKMCFKKAVSVLRRLGV